MTALYTFQICLNEALKHNTPSDWERISRATYAAASRNGWLKECTKHMNIRVTWTFDKCKEVCAECTTIKELAGKYNGAYKIILRNNWDTELFKNMDKIPPHNKYWTKEKCKEAVLVCQTRKELNEKFPTAYSAILKNKWAKELFKDFKILRLRMTDEEIVKEARKHNSVKEWKEAHPQSYWAAKKKKILNICKSEMKNLRGDWANKEICFNEARKYKSISEWIEKSPGSYTSALRHNWLPEFKNRINFKVKRANVRSKEDCHKLALQYMDRMSFFRNNRGAYMRAWEKNWLEEICSHMKMLGGTSIPEIELFKCLSKYFPNLKNNKRFYRKGIFLNKPYIKCFELDILARELNLGIEFNGEYWHTFESLKKSHPTWPDEDVKNYHEIKREFFRILGIDYIEINETEWLDNKEDCIKRCLDFLSKPNKLKSA